MVMNGPVTIFAASPQRVFPETEIQHFRRLAFEHSRSVRRLRRQERRARLRSLVQRAA
jgi:hypothetical protein